MAGRLRRHRSLHNAKTNESTIRIRERKVLMTIPYIVRKLFKIDEHGRINRRPTTGQIFVISLATVLNSIYERGCSIFFTVVVGFGIIHVINPAPCRSDSRVQTPCGNSRSQCQNLHEENNESSVHWWFAIITQLVEISVMEVIGCSRFLIRVVTNASQFISCCVHFMIRNTGISCAIPTIKFIGEKFPLDYIQMAFSLAFVALVFWIKHLLKKNAEITVGQETLKENLDEEHIKLAFEKERHSAALKEIRELKWELQGKRELNLALTKKSSKLEVQIKDLRSKTEEERKVNIVLDKEKIKLESQLGKMKSKLVSIDKLRKDFQEEKAKLRSQKEDSRLRLKEAKKLNLKLEKELSELRANNQILKTQLDVEKDKRLCDICSDSQKNILLTPCNHFCMCAKCLEYKKWVECPICRQVIKSTIAVFD